MTKYKQKIGMLYLLFVTATYSVTTLAENNVLHAGAKNKQKEHTITVINFTKVNKGTIDILFSDKSHKSYSAPRINDIAPDSFGEAKISPNKKSIVWAPMYAVCPQSYSCIPELFLINQNNLFRILPDRGVVWSWKYTNNGLRVEIHSGFPHGDTDGLNSVYETISGKRLRK